MNTIGLATFAVYTDDEGFTHRIPAPRHMEGDYAKAWHRLVMLRAQHRADEMALAKVVRHAAHLAGATHFTTHAAIRAADELVYDHGDNVDDLTFRVTPV